MKVPHTSACTSSTSYWSLAVSWQPQTTLRASAVDGHPEHKAFGSSDKSRWSLRERFPLGKS